VRWSRALPSGGQGVGIDGRDDVEEAAYDDEFGAVVGGGHLNGGGAQIEDAGENVEDAVAEVAGEVEDVEDLAGVGGVDFALEREANDEHGEDGERDETAAYPFAEHEVACSGDEPSGDEDHRGEGGRLGARCGGCVGGHC
jgi:hypothetical protein